MVELEVGDHRNGQSWGEDLRGHQSIHAQLLQPICTLEACQTEAPEVVTWDELSGEEIPARVVVGRGYETELSLHVRS